MIDLNNNTKNGEHNTQRNTSYRAMIPFYILFDLDLNANHIRMYGQIEQMESNPNPNVSPTFSYQWLADQLGINRRNTISLAKIMIEKKLIEHVQNQHGQWFWRTVKAQVFCLDSECLSSTSVAQRHPLVSPSDTPLVSPSDTQRSQKLTSKNINNKTHVKECVEQKKIGKKEINPIEYKETYYGESLHQLTPKDEVVEESFKLFWNHYPKKKNEKKSRLLWINQNCHEHHEMIISKLLDQIAKDSAFLDGYAPDPANYIAGERWNDDIDARKKNKPDAVLDQNSDWINIPKGLLD